MAIAAALVGLLAVACGGGGGGGSSPTAPEPTLAMVLLIENADGQPTFAEASLSFDGAHVGSATSNPPAPASPTMHANVQAAAGGHIVRITIVAQTVSPSRYTVSGTATWSGRAITIPTTTASVATGQFLEFPVTL